MSNDNAKQFRARLRREAQAINERNRVPGDLYYKEPAPLPEQPARDGDVWHVQQVLPGEPRAIFDSQNRLVATAISGDLATTIVTDHARAALVPGLVEALRQMRDGFQFHTCQNEYCVQCNALTLADKHLTRYAAARKAGVE